MSAAYTRTSVSVIGPELVTLAVALYESWCREREGPTTCAFVHFLDTPIDAQFEWVSRARTILSELIAYEDREMRRFAREVCQDDGGEG